MANETHVMTDKNKFWGQLHEAMTRSYRRMLRYRISANDCRVQFTGHMQREEGQTNNDQPVVMPKLFQLVTTYMRLLASNRPQVLISTEYQDLRPFAHTLELAVNRLITEINLEEELSKAVLDAMFGIGVLKTGLADGDESFEVDGHLYDVAQPFSAVVPLNDLVMDMDCYSREKMTFIGDRYLRPIDWIQTRYKKGPKEYGGVDRRISSDMNPGTNEPVETPESRLYESEYLWDVWIPQHNLFVTMCDSSTVPLEVIDWDGPERGPYDLLSFQDAPFSVMPVAIAPVMYELHMATNEIMRKLVRQANRQKTILTYEEGDSERDAGRIVDANDADSIRVSNVDRVKEVRFGGMDPGNFNSQIYLNQQFNLMAGNLDALAGLAPQSETARQDTMLRESANALVDNMRRHTLSFAKRVIRKHAWYLWTEPVREMLLHKTVDLPDGSTIRVPVTFTPEEREGDFLDYNVEIVPFSMVEETPGQKIQTLMQMLSQFVIPSADMAMQAGLMPNFDRIARQLAKYANLPFEDLYVSQNDTEMAGKIGKVAPPARMAQNTTRTYERVSRPGTTPQATENSLMQANSGMSAQNPTASGAMQV